MDCQKQHRLQRRWGGGVVNGRWGEGQRYGGLGYTYHFLCQDECQVLQVVLVAQGPCREGREVWGGHGSQTLEEVVLESRGGQYGSQLKERNLFSSEGTLIFPGVPQVAAPSPDKLTEMGAGRRDLPSPSGTFCFDSSRIATPCPSPPCLTPNQARKSHLVT